MILSQSGKLIKKYTNFFRDKSIDFICKTYDIKDYSINVDGSIDVDGYVNFHNAELTKFPLKFNKVSGYFDCSENKLTSLKGCPEYVGGHFYCSYNKLDSLKEGPSSVGGYFDCTENKIKSLEGSPKSVGRYFICSTNHLISLEGFPEFFEGQVHIHDNPVFEIINLFPSEKYDKSIFWLNEFEVIREGKQVVLDRLEEVFIQMGLDISSRIEFKNYEII